MDVNIFLVFVELRAAVVDLVIVHFLVTELGAVVVVVLLVVDV